MAEHTGETTILRRPAFVPGGRVVAAGRGWAWIAEGWRHVAGAPAFWFASGAAMLLALSACVYAHLAGAPLVGFMISMAIVVLSPAWTAGMMVAAAKADAREAPNLGDLAAGFRGPAARLVTLGAIFLVASLAVMVVAALVVKAAGIGLASAEQMMSGHMDEAQMMAVLKAALLYLVIALAMHVPLLMAMWFAAPLVVFHELGVAAAMKSSFAGCARNAAPFLVYGVAALLLAIPATLTLLLGWFVLLPVVGASIYTGYKDLYLSE